MASSKQLISQFKPDSYSLDLNLNKQNKTFEGRLLIKGARRSKPSYRLTFNQNGLKVTQAKIFKLDKGSRTELKIIRIVHQAKLQEVRLHCEAQLISGTYEVELEYSGKIATKGTTGVYTSKWLDDSSGQQEIITTQFEPHYARELLPCIDEPEAKSVFSLNLTLKGVAENETVLFNTNITAQEQAGPVRKVSFEPTPIMSTYLLALVIGELKSKSKESQNGTQVSVYSTPDKLESTAFALDFATKALDFLEGKFQTQYPLEKLDLVAVPDFDTGGMENWGLATFREDLLLFDESNSTLLDKQSIALVVAHEVAHQWFGNLVTMKWWDELWLNEGFANFIEYYTVDKLFPEWKMLESYIVNEKSYAIRLDSLPSSRAIVKKVTSPHHAVEIFDAIAYEKSGSIIRMIFSMIGEENFMLGLRDYFAKFSYKSSSSSDLLACWQKYSKLNLTKFTKTWLYEPGLPLLEVSIGGNPTKIKLEQSRFFSESKPKINIAKVQEKALKDNPNLQKKQREFFRNQIANKISKIHEPIWDIPIDFVGARPDDSILPSFVMTKQKHVVQLPKGSSLPLKLNKDGSAFYVASYSLEFLTSIGKSIQDSKLSDLDTLNLLSDIISLNRAGRFTLGAGAILEIIKSGRKLDNPQFWGLTGGFIGYLHYHLKQINETKLLSSYVCELIDSRLQEIGFESSAEDNSGVTITRFELLSLAALAKDSAFTAKLTELYDNSLQEGIASIESEKRLLSLYAVAKRGKKADYKELLKSYRDNLSDVSLRDDLTYALCLFEDEVSVKNNLSIMQDTELVKEQDILSWLSQVINSGHTATNITLEWVTKQNGWQWLEHNLSAHDLSTAVKVVFSTAFTTAGLNKLKKFFNNLDNIELEKAIDESCDIAKSRISWHKKELKSVIDYLR